MTVVRLSGGPADGREVAVDDPPPRVYRISLPNRQVVIDPATGAVLEPGGRDPLAAPPLRIVHHDYGPDPGGDPLLWTYRQERKTR